MRKGNGPSNIIGTSEMPQTMAIDVRLLQYGCDCRTMTGYLKNEEVVQMTRNEESPSHININRDGDDRQSLRRTLLSCINPVDPDTHPC